MAKELKQQEPTSELEAVPEVVGPPASYRLQITLGFISLILFQMIILWLLLPSRTQVQTRIGVDPLDGRGFSENFDTPGIVPPNMGKGEDLVEKAISEKVFTVKNVRNELNETFSVDIRVGIRQADEKKFNQRYEKCMYEIRDRVTAILNASSDEDRMEAALTTIKEKIKRAINEVLGSPLVQRVYCTDVGLVTQ